MSAPNFSCRHNAQYIYAFCDHSDFEKYVEDNKDVWDIKDKEEMEEYLNSEYLYSDWYDSEKEYYLEWLEEELNKVTASGTGLYSDFTEVLAHHICDGEEIATVRKSIEFAGGEFTVEASIDFEAGYYEGFSLDWNIKSIQGYCGGYDFDYMPDLEDCRYLLEENTDLNAGLCKALAAKLLVRLEAALDDVTGAIEKALQTVCPYHLTGFCLCNGEGIYTNHKEDNKAA